MVPLPTEIQTVWTRFSKAPPPVGTTCTKIAAGGDTSYFAIEGLNGNEVVSCGYGVNAQLGNGSVIKLFIFYNLKVLSYATTSSED